MMISRIMMLAGLAFLAAVMAAGTPAMAQQTRNDHGLGRSLAHQPCRFIGHCIGGYIKKPPLAGHCHVGHDVGQWNKDQINQMISM